MESSDSFTASPDVNCFQETESSSVVTSAHQTSENEHTTKGINAPVYDSKLETEDSKLENVGKNNSTSPAINSYTEVPPPTKENDQIAKALKDGKTKPVSPVVSTYTEVPPPTTEKDQVAKALNEPQSPDSKSNPKPPSRKNKSPAPQIPENNTNQSHHHDEKNESFSEKSVKTGNENVSTNEARSEINPTSQDSKKITKKKSLSFKENFNEKMESKVVAYPQEDRKVEEVQVSLREKPEVNPEDSEKFQRRVSYMMKTKGKLFYKKKGPFAKWKIYYIVVDDFKMQMNFFKSQEEYENLAGCKLSIDLRFVTEIKPQKPRILQSNFPFKLLRRAGLSTVKLAAYNEEERAKWITTIEGMMQKIKISTQMDVILEEKRSSTLPNQIMSTRTSSDSETQTSVSAPDQDELIRPKKISNSGFKLDSHQISSVKLKRISSEKKEPDLQKQEIEYNDDVFDPKEKFGVNLRRVQTEKSPSRSERQSAEYMEFKEKYNSLSLSRKNKVPKLPLNENSVCSHLVENISREESKPNDRLQNVKETKESNRKRSPSPNIPISKSVEAVIRNKGIDAGIEQIPSKLSVCHATSTVISYYESSELKLDENVDNQDKDSSSKTIESFSASSEMDNKENDNSKCSATITKPDIMNTCNVTPNDKSNILGPEMKLVLKSDGTTEIGDSKPDEIINSVETTEQVIGSEAPVESTEQVIDSEAHVESTEQVIDSEAPDDDIPKKDIPRSVNPKKDIPKNNSPFEKQISSLSIELKTPGVENNAVQEKEKLTEVEKLTKDDSDIPEKPLILENDEDTGRLESKSSFEIPVTNVEQRKLNGILSQKQIDSIVFGGETQSNDDLASENNNELCIPWNASNDLRSSFHSYQSQFSTESDEPLPRFNFLGGSKEDRSSSGSASMKESFSLEENRTHATDSEESLCHDVMRDKPSKPRNYIRPDSSGSLEQRLSLTLPEFTVVEEKADDVLMPEEHKQLSSTHLTNKENNNSISESKDKDETVMTITNEIKNNLDNEDKDTEYEEQDILPTQNTSADSSDSLNVNESHQQIKNDKETPKVMITLDEDEKRTYVVEDNINPDYNAENKEIPIIIEPENTNADIDKDTNGNIIASVKCETNETEEMNDPGEDTKQNKERGSDNEKDDIRMSADHSLNSSSATKEGGGGGGRGEDMEEEETEDYFPSYGNTVYRIKEEDTGSKNASNMRTSGIVGLKEFLRENSNENETQDIKCGISRLGHSPAIEKLRNEFIE